MTAMPEMSVSKAIEDYIGRGWSIIPIRARDKRPLIQWEEFQHRRADLAEAYAWFSSWPAAGIAVVTGSISNIVVVDIDPRHGGDESIERFEQQHGRLPVTVECRSGGGGRHLYFAHPATFVRNKVGFAPGVDLRGDGGYVVAPPSVHTSGVGYAWKEDCRPESTNLATLPGWFLSQAIDGVRSLGRSISHWRRLVRDGVREGQRNNTVASLAGHLLRRGVDRVVVMELLLCWNRGRCEPPLVDEEVVTVVESIGRFHPRADRPGAQL